MTEAYQPSIARVMKKVRLGEQPSDADYWRSLPYQERLAALEQLRQSFHQWKYHAQPGFQRVYKIIKR